MDVGIAFGMLNMGLWPAMAERADELGFESLWIPEHLVIPHATVGSPFAGADHPPVPSNVPIYDVFTTLGHLAATTSRIKLGTNVYNIGLRHPFTTARGATTVDVLSGGRLLLGIGASWLRAEWEAVGLDFDRRGERVDEAIDVCRRLWTDEVIEHHGTHFDFGPTAFEPKPVQQPLPLHIGGDGPAALRRAATIGAGWMPMNQTLETLPATAARLRERAEEAGRTTPVELTITTSASTRAELDQLAEAGVTRAIVHPWKRSSEALDAVSRFADEVLAAD
jgi:probable F420-dependent oxidoreductase